MAANWLYPKFPLRLLPRMLGLAGLGAIAGGMYGILHDQVTYSISREYFTRYKFQQFAHADFGFPARIFVAEIGFLATWWVGGMAVWFLARLALPKAAGAEAIRRIKTGVAILWVSSVACAGGGAFAARRGWYDSEAWEVAAGGLQVGDVDAFVMVAFIHNGSYFGALAGWIAAMVFVWRSLRHQAAARA